MELGSKFVYLGNERDDFEDVKVSAVDDVALSDSDCSDDDGETCVLDILDTAGQEEFSSLRDQYVRTGNGFVIIYSITDRRSVQEAETIYNWLKRVRGETFNAVLVANKQDLAGTKEVEVTQQEGRVVAQKLGGIPFYETSAKTGFGVQSAIQGLVKIMPRVSSDYKIVMLGAGAVGKSSITLRFVSDSFVDDYDPTIEDSFRKMISVPGLKALTKEQKKSLRKRPNPVSHSAEASTSQSQFAPARKLRRKAGQAKCQKVRSGTGNQRTDKPYIFGKSESEAKSVREKKVDGNVVLIPLRNLENETNLVSGEPITCKRCRAILTCTGKLEGSDGTKSWTCEFCGELNENLDISENEIPKENESDYMISPPTKSKEEEGAATTSEKKLTPGTLVYCMDISSSMHGVCHVPESHTAWREERARGEEPVARVTRLKCIQNAIERLAEELKLEQPQKKVLLVVFSSTVQVKAGGGPVPFPAITAVGGSFDQLVNAGVALSDKYPLECIEETHEAIDSEVKALHPTGCTALGPALSICLGFVSKVPSSEIILCTDGEPNEGIGRNGRADFYQMAGNFARSKNITINILAMEGASTGLQYVSKAAEHSGGATIKLNPVEIVRQLRQIAQNEVVATGVTVRFYLHPHFVFDEPDFPDSLSQLEKEVGSVKMETDLTFKFKVKDGVKGQQIKSVPFQVQIEYTRPDGMRCLRVLSKSSEATDRRQDMEENINVSVVGVSAMKTTAKMAQAGQSTQAQHMVKNFKRLVDRGAKSSKQREERAAFKHEVSKWDSHLTVHHKRMRNSKLQDEDADIFQTTKKTNMVQQTAAVTKMAVATKRKMNAKGKAAYYAYKSKI